MKHHQYQKGEYIAFDTTLAGVWFGRVVGVTWRSDVPLGESEFSYEVAPFNAKHFFGLPMRVESRSIRGLIQVPKTTLLLLRANSIIAFGAGLFLGTVITLLAHLIGGI